jgi:hypothetical protein
MSKVPYVLLPALFVFLHCSCRDQVVANRVVEPEKDLKQMIHIQNVESTEKSLLLHYIVSNPYDHEIWICEDIDRRGKYDVETRIVKETLYVRIHLHLEANILPIQSVYAKYCRLAPGNSRPGRVVLSLPVSNASPLYDFHDRYKRRKKITLRRVCLELGYFEGNLLTTISERIKKDESEAKKIRKSRSQDDVIYLSDIWPGLVLEKVTKAVATDVDIPCSVQEN